MKKYLTLSLTILLGLAACKKDAKMATGATPVTQTETNKAVNVVQPDYVELTLIPRAAGENFDTYRGYWNDCGIQVRGPVVYNFQKYPNLVNGVPVVMASIGTYDGTSNVDYVNTGPDGNVFAVTQVYIGSTNFTDFHKDLKTYFGALDIYNTSGDSGAQPTLGSVVKDSYTTASSAKTYIGKLIRITSGSHLAIAKVSYALPAAAIASIQPLGDAVVQDELDPSKQYLLHGSGGKITEVIPMFTTVPSGIFIVTGTYTSLSPGTQNFHIWGTIKRADDSFSKFNLDQQTN